ncbi:hypothetical protein [Pediococcus acidilactici]|uniref:hypothetical protein n=1 Tax=Pediococcus acidilactici TaxID=1254 RepID=UPI001330FA1C|nr:hypothetical protein [Pediococcus acidilactici]MDO7802078.1 hypothetical protein [Pediococcus acidilactici]
MPIIESLRKTTFTVTKIQPNPVLTIPGPDAKVPRRQKSFENFVIIRNFSVITVSDI